MRLTNKRILVTGGAGFIGSHLVDQLILEKPERIVVVDDMSLGKEENLADARKAFRGKLKFHRADAGDFAAMEKILKVNRIDVVFHLAAIPLGSSLVQPKADVDSAIRMATTICELQRLKRFRTLIAFSTSEVYGTAQYVPIDERHPLGAHTPYAAAKAGADLVVMSYVTTFGIDAAIVRPFNNYGPRQNEGNYAGVIPITIKRILEGKTPILNGDGSQTRDFLYVGDTARTTIEIYENPKTRGLALNLGSGKEISMKDLVAEIARQLRWSKPPLRRKPRPGDVQRLLADMRLARKVIGFKPRTSFRDGLRETVQWYERALG